MGMLLSHHDGYWPDGEAVEPEAVPVEVSPWSELTDDELFDAYVTNVDGEAESREDMIAELDALSAGE